MAYRINYKKIYKDTLSEMLTFNSISEISVDDIVAYSQTGSRSTFYNHCKSIYALSEDILNDVIDHSYELMKNDNRAEQLTELLIANKYLIDNILRVLKKPELRGNYRNIYEKSINSFVNSVEKQSGREFSQNERVILGLSISGLFLGRLWPNESEIERDHIQKSIEAIFEMFLK